MELIKFTVLFLIIYGLFTKASGLKCHHCEGPSKRKQECGQVKTNKSDFEPCEPHEKYCVVTINLKSETVLRGCTHEGNKTGCVEGRYQNEAATKECFCQQDMCNDREMSLHGSTVTIFPIWQANLGVPLVHLASSLVKHVMMHF